MKTGVRAGLERLCDTRERGAGQASSHDLEPGGAVLPEPLHPAVVHLPLALAVLLPFFAVLALWAIRRGVSTSTAWALPVLFALVLTGSAWVALQTGEADEGRVEEVVSEAAIHDHEEAAEQFVLVAGVVSLLAMVGLAGGALGSAGRLLATAGTVVVLAAGVQTGARGGDLVYEHGAAGVYAGDAPSNPVHDDDRERDARP